MLDLDNLHGYQHTAKDHILKHSHSGLFLDMGLGKTVSTLTAINHLIFESLEIAKVLVVAPKRVAESVWGAEIHKWRHLKHLKTSLIAGNPKQRRKALSQEADIYLIGRDNIAWLCGQYGGSMLPFDMLVIDESSSFKNPKSVRFKALRGVQPSFKRVVLLTGTPAPNSLIDLWSQIYLLDRGERLGKFISSYRETYFKEGKRNGHIVYNYNLREQSEQLIHSAISDICVSMKAEDYLDLPGRIENIVSIPMPDSIKEKYEEFEKEQVLQLFTEQNEEAHISAVNAAVLTNKLLQFANGALYDEDKNVHEIHTLKLEALQELVESANGKPVLLAWTFRSDVPRIMKVLKEYKPKELKTDQDIQDWNAGKIKVLMMHPASGGHGLNLQAGGNNIIWFGQTWSLELEEQFNARLDRQGQKNVVVINKICLEGSMDIDVVEAQKRKALSQDSLMEAVKAKIKKYLK